MKSCKKGTIMNQSLTPILHCHLIIFSIKIFDSLEFWVWTKLKTLAKKAITRQKIASKLKRNTREFDCKQIVWAQRPDIGKGNHKKREDALTV